MCGCLLLSNHAYDNHCCPPCNRSCGCALDDILSDRAALEAHFGIHLDSDESDLEVPSDEWTDDGKNLIGNEKQRSLISFSI